MTTMNFEEEAHVGKLIYKINIYPLINIFYSSHLFPHLSIQSTHK